MNPMDRAFRDVLEFHRKFGCVVGSRPGVPLIDTTTMRMALISEECDELETALSEDDIPGIADSVADLIYVLLGTAVSYGIDMREVWRAVHAANMAKVGGGLRGDGKVLKPPDWVAPDVAGILERQGSLGEIPSGESG
jgi:predicted HAD superfamily Cof-like phosphohydrolase